LEKLKADYRLKLRKCNSRAILLLVGGKFVGAAAPRAKKSGDKSPHSEK